MYRKLKRNLLQISPQRCFYTLTLINGYNAFSKGLLTQIHALATKYYSFINIYEIVFFLRKDRNQKELKLLIYHRLKCCYDIKFT